MSFFQEDLRVSGDVIRDFDGFADYLSNKVREEVFEDAGGRHDGRMAEGRKGGR
jgi:hypothetical protein